MLNYLGRFPQRVRNDAQPLKNYCHAVTRSNRDRRCQILNLLICHLFLASVAGGPQFMVDNPRHRRRL
jgi:hypothetical protein